MKLVKAGRGFSILNTNRQILAFQVPESDLIFAFEKLGCKVTHQEIQKALYLLQYQTTVHLYVGKSGNRKR